MSKQLVGLRFLLLSGSFLDVIEEEDKARSTVELFGTNWPRTPGVCFGNISPEGAWSVHCPDVIAVHTFALPQQVNIPAPKGSGLQLPAPVGWPRN